MEDITNTDYRHVKRVLEVFEAEYYGQHSILVFENVRNVILDIYELDPLRIPLGGNIPLGENNLFSACYRNVGRKKF